MQLGLHLNRLALQTDYLCSALQVKIWDRPGYLITFFIHGLFLDEHEVDLDLCYPQQRITLQHLETAIVSFQRAGYRFISPSEILQGLDSTRRYCLLTFDDGYYNNRRALGLLEKYDVPAIFFVPAELVEKGHGFWWDQLYRFRRSQGVSSAEVCSEISRRAQGRTCEIEQDVLRLTGAATFAPVGDTDRSFTPEELRQFASHPKVHIGNHGYGHEFLTYYSTKEATERLWKAQQVLKSITGKAPVSIAYPVGGYSAELIAGAMEMGLKLGFTTVPTKADVRQLADPRNRMRIGRFVLENHPGILAQSIRMRSDLLIHYRYERLVKNVKRLLRHGSN